MIPELSTRTSVAGSPPIATRAPARKFVPEIVIRVPPSGDPDRGDTVIFEGCGSIITIPPLTTAVSLPRVTTRFFGPSGVEDGTVISISTAVGTIELFWVLKV